MRRAVIVNADSEKIERKLWIQKIRRQEDSSEKMVNPKMDLGMIFQGEFWVLRRLGRMGA